MSIRTTVTLDEDVFERLKQESRSRGIPFRDTLNQILRVGLLAGDNSLEPRQFRVEPRHMGTLPGVDYDNVSALLELGEGGEHR